MGTGTDDSHIKEEAEKRQFVMAKLYRGSLDILRQKHEALGTTLISHVRSFDKPADEAEFAYVESMGYWRMVVELIFHIYIQLSLFTGITIIVLLTILAWPIRFLIELFSGSWFLAKSPVFEEPARVPPSLEPVPDDHVDDGKVVRRVVYEEAKVPKK